MARKYPSEIPFASLLVYSPRGRSDLSRRSKEVVRDPLKAGESATAARVALRTREAVERGKFRGYFAGDVVLVPMPQRAPRREGWQWPAEVLARALVKEGLGASVHAYLLRTRVVPKSSTMTSGKTRTVQLHVGSLEVQRELSAPERIVLVDDIVTTGATLLAGVMLLRESFPEADVRAFAGARSMGDTEIEALLAPCEGTISLVDETGGNTRRRP